MQKVISLIKPGDVAGGRPAEPLQKALSASIKKPFASKIWNVDNFQVAAACGSDGKVCKVFVVANSESPLILNYGVAGTNKMWQDTKAVALNKVNGLRSTELVIAGEDVKESFVFVLGAQGGKLLKDGHQDFELGLPQDSTWRQARALKEDLKKALSEFEAEPFASKTWHIDNFQVAAVSGFDGKACRLKIVTTAEAPLKLHYGFADVGGKWNDDNQVALKRVNNLQSTDVEIAGEEAVHALFKFVLQASNNKYIKNGQQDFELELPREGEREQVRQRKEREADAARAEQEFIAAAKEAAQKRVAAEEEMRKAALQKLEEAKKQTSRRGLQQRKRSAEQPSKSRRRPKKQRR
jgi:hypothetical protein